ncbi:MAG TPA: hypothetical protein VKZ89_21105, partial [Thermobifida alba]|nr:hypothetical protein [Thermobifida alba]
WYYEYEPVGVEFDDGTRYLCDFHLPAQNVWCEVKGPHNLGLAKAHRFHRATREDRPGGTLVVVLRPAGPGGAANWHNVTGERRISIHQCEVCREWSFVATLIDDWKCRVCKSPDALIRGLGDACRSYVPATALEALKRETSHLSCDYLKEVFGPYGRLPLARAPRGGRTA